MTSYVVAVVSNYLGVSNWCYLKRQTLQTRNSCLTDAEMLKTIDIEHSQFVVYRPQDSENGRQKRLGIFV